MKRWLVVAAILALPVTAHADAAKIALAKEAYNRGVAAHDKGDFAAAARAFAEADALSPSRAAFQAALDDAIEADDPVIGAELVERSKLVASTTPELNASIVAAKKKFAGRAGRIHVTHAEACTTATLDDKTVVDPKKEIWTTRGIHTIDIVCGPHAGESHVDVRADDVITIEAPNESTPKPEPKPVPTPVVVTKPVTKPETTAPAPTPAEPSRKPLGIAVPIVGGVVTLLFGTAAIYFGLRAGNRHDDFVARGCDTANVDGCSDLQDRGRTSQTYANIGIGTGAAAAVGTLVSLFFTDFHRPDAPKVGIAPVSGGFAGSYAFRF